MAAISLPRPRKLVTPGNLALVIVLALTVAWFMFARPPALGGGTSYVWVNGISMEPSLYDGDLAVVREQSSYGPGDVVAFRAYDEGADAEHTVIHRIIGGSAEDGYVTQGDNRQYPDRWNPTDDDVIGKMWFSVPGAGRWFATLQAPVLLAGLGAAITLFLILSGGTRQVRRARQRAAAAAGPQFAAAPPPTPVAEPPVGLDIPPMEVIHLPSAAAPVALLAPPTPPSPAPPPAEAVPITARRSHKRARRAPDISRPVPLPAFVLVVAGLIAALFFAAKR